MKKFILMALVLGLGLVGYSQSQNQKRASRAANVQGVIIFTDAEPLQDYETVGEVKRNTGGFGCPQYECVRDGLIKRAKKEYGGEFDAMIFYLNRGGSDRAVCIKFKE